MTHRNDLLDADSGLQLGSKAQPLVDAIRKAEAEYKGQSDPKLDGLGRSFGFRAYVLSNAREAVENNPDFKKFESRNFVVFLIPINGKWAAIKFKKLRRGYTASQYRPNGSPRSEAISLQQESLTVNGELITPTWIYLGWLWDITESFIQHDRLICVYRNEVLWMIEQDRKRRNEWNLVSQTAIDFKQFEIFDEDNFFSPNLKDNVSNADEQSTRVRIRTTSQNSESIELFKPNENTGTHHGEAGQKQSTSNGGQ